MIQPQETPPTPKKPLWARPLLQVIAVGAVLAAGAVALVTFQNQSVAEYETAIETHRLELKAYDIMAAGWRAGLGNSFPPETAPDPEFARIEAVESVAALEMVVADYDANWTDRGTESVRAKLAEYVTPHREILNLIAQGRGFETFPILGAALLTFGEVRVEAAQATAEAIANAERTHDYSRIGSIAVLIFAFGAISGMVILYRSADRKTANTAAEQEILRRSEARFRPLIQSASDVISIVDVDGIIKYISPSIARLSDSQPDDFVGESMMAFVTGEDARQLRSLLSEVSERPGYTQAAEVQVQSRGEPHRTRHVQIICTNCLQDPDINGLVLNLRDISDRKELETQLRHQAFHDSLTGLANRLRFLDRLAHTLERGKRDSGKLVSVLYLDLDYFKNVNDEMGHTAGDELLKLVADRVQGCIRSTDTAARLGGDEFAILLEDQHTVDAASAIAEVILQQLKLPFQVLDRDVFISASIGVVVADPNLMTAEEIIRDADVAMYDAKENGRGRIQVFEPTMQLSLVERLLLTNDLNGAIERDELQVYYQPLLFLRDERIAGFEALVRWCHPKRGLLPPAQFISLAEESGFIHDLGYFVLFEACRQAQEWKEKYPDRADFTLSVNVSARQLQKPGYVQEVQRILASTGFDPRMLVLEITESVLIRHPQDVIGSLEELKQLGLHLALDDFGTGYSSLSYLKRFPIDILKIDRSFIEGMNETDRDMMLVQTVIDLGHTLKLDIVAEGIERSEQLESLQALDCALGQGYLFAKPLDASSAEAMLRDQAAGPSLPSRDDGGSGKEIRVA